MVRYLPTLTFETPFAIEAFVSAGGVKAMMDVLKMEKKSINFQVQRFSLQK